MKMVTLKDSSHHSKLILLLLLTLEGVALGGGECLMCVL